MARGATELAGAGRPATLPDHEPSLAPILQRVALAANSSLDVEEVLEQLARLTLEAIPGDRCAIFLLEDGERLVPKMGVGRVPNEAEWERFQRSTPIDLKGESERWQAFSAGRAIYFPNLASSPLVPKRFVRSFGARCALVVPLVANGESLGLLSVDWRTPGHLCSDEEIALVETIGTYVALAIRNARLFEGLATKTRTLERMVDVAGALNSAASLGSVLELVCSAFEELLGTSLCAVDLLDPRASGTVRTVAARGKSSLKRRLSSDGSAASMPSTAAAEIERIVKRWNRSAKPLVFPDLDRRGLPKHLAAVPRKGSAVLFPLSRPGRTLGYVLAAFPSQGRPSAERLAAGQALAQLAATATARAHLHQELRSRLQRVEILHRLSDVIAGAAELVPTLRKLTGLLPRDLGVRFESISLGDRRLRDAIGASAPSDEEMAAIRSWRAVMAKGPRSARPRHTPAGVLVPIVHRRRVLGVLNVAVDPSVCEPPDDELLLAIASGCAEVVHKTGLYGELAESRRRLAVVAERERIARDLHDSVGQLLTGLGMRLVEYTEDASDPVWHERLDELRELATRGSREIRDAIQSLLFVKVRRQGLAKSLRELARKFEATTGIRVTTRISGAVTSLATIAEDALFRVAHEALMNAERHSGAASIVLALAYAGDGVTVSVTDDGVGLGGRDPFGGPRGHFGLSGLRGLVEEAGGEFEVCDLIPRGVRVDGHIPLGTRSRRVRP